MSLVDTVFGDPVLLTALTVIIYGLVRYQRGLSWYEYRTIHGLKVEAAKRLDNRLTLRLVTPKQRPGGYEFVRHDERSPRTVAREFVRAGGAYHLVNSIKSRPGGDGCTQYSVAHVVFLHDNETQTEVYLFRHADGGVDVYAHHETAVTDPDGHIRETEQIDGDPRGVLARVYGEQAEASALSGVPTEVCGLARIPAGRPPRAAHAG